MSKVIREYVSCENGMKVLEVVAFVAGAENGREGVVFAVRDSGNPELNARVALTGKQVKDLLEVLIKRINFRPLFRATDFGEYMRVYPDGSMIKGGED